MKVKIAARGDLARYCFRKAMGKSTSPARAITPSDSPEDDLSALFSGFQNRSSHGEVRTPLLSCIISHSSLNCLR